MMLGDTQSTQENQQQDGAQDGIQVNDGILADQTAIQMLEGDRQVTEQPADDKPADGATKEGEVKTEERVDPRAARMERLAERSHERQVEEHTQATEAVTEPGREAPAKAEQTVEQQPERMMKIKVRGEWVDMPESEVIARAQKVDAADSYLSEAKAVMDEVKGLKREMREPPATDAAVRQEQEQKTEQKVDRLREAIDKIQVGADPEEIRGTLDEVISERVREGVDQALEGRAQQSVQQAFDTEIDDTFAGIVNRDEYKTMAADPIAMSVVAQVANGLEREVIINFLASSDDATRDSFAQARITADGVKSYSPVDVHALYKSMVAQGYQIHRPGKIVEAAAKTVFDRFQATTQAPKTQQSAAPAIDRTARKEAISQPTSASIPRDQSGRFAPQKTEGERSSDARKEMRSDRRAGARR